MIQFNNVSKQFPDGTYAVKSFDAVIKKANFLLLSDLAAVGKPPRLK